MSDLDDKIEYVNPYHLKPDPNNPRTVMDEEFINKLVENYREHGIIEPIEIDENNIIRRGHQRVEAAKRAGLDRVPVRRVIGLSPEKWFERQLADDELRNKLPEIDKIWSYVTGIVNINTGRFHKVEQVKEMYKKDKSNLLNLIDCSIGKVGGGREKSGQAELARRIGAKQPTISNYVIVLKIDAEYSGTLEAIEKGRTDRSKIIEAYNIGHKKLRDIVMGKVIRGEFKEPATVGDGSIRSIRSLDNQPEEIAEIIAERINEGLSGNALEKVLVELRDEATSFELKVDIAKGEIRPEVVREIKTIEDEEIKKIVVEKIKSGDIKNLEHIKEIKSVIRNESIPREVKVSVAKGDVPLDKVDVAVALHRAGKPITVSVQPPSKEEIERVAQKSIEWEEDLLKFTKDFGIQVRRLYFPLMTDLNFIRQFASGMICPICGKQLKLRLDCCGITLDEAYDVAYNAWKTKTPPNEEMRRLIEERREKQVPEFEKRVEKVKKEYEEILKNAKEEVVDD